MWASMKFLPPQNYNVYLKVRIISLVTGGGGGGGLLNSAAVVPCEQRSRKIEETSARRALKWSNGWKFCSVVLIWKICELRMLGSGSIHNIHDAIAKFEGEM